MASTKKSSKEETKKKSSKQQTPTKPSKNITKTPNATQQEQSNSKLDKRKREENDNEVGEDGLFCRFPTARIKRIIKTEDPLLALSSDAVFLVNKATEMFLEKFSEDGFKCLVRDRKKSLNYNHLASVVSEERRYDFLSDFVPEKVRAEEALSRKKLVENGQG